MTPPRFFSVRGLCFLETFHSFVTDFAVGAPFYDTGRVYIWMGDKDEVSQEPSQVTSNYVPDVPYYNINGPLHASMNTFL